jgi:hypothetical protein
MANISCIACSVLRPELEALQARGLLDFPIRYLSSRLHMIPGELHRRMAALLEKELEKGRRVLLLYGNCHPYMGELEARPGVVRVPGVNCANILIGRDLYKRLVKENVYFLFFEWIHRWREILVKFPGCDEKTTRDLMREHSRLVYLDTGLYPVPEESLNQCSRYFDLPFQVLPVSIDHLPHVIREAVKKLTAGRDLS